ncbi:MAG: tetrahydrofolate dehydrogenase/cyclohydrolase catalytic domain-containing protein, partial [Acidaminobacteraceae bacterium]
MGEIIKGKAVADAMTEALLLEVEALKEKNVYPKLKIVRVGNNESDLAYERGALKRMEKCGILSEVLELPLEISQDDFIKELSQVNADPAVNGILLFRPLPSQLDEEVIKHVISAEKDIDCLNPGNVAKVMEGDKTGFPPCTPTACVEILKFYNVPLKGAN